MRDERYIKSSVIMSMTYEFDPPSIESMVDWTSYHKTDISDHVRLDAARDDISWSDGVRPTHYWARSFSSTPKPSKVYGPWRPYYYSHTGSFRYREVWEGLPGENVLGYGSIDSRAGDVRFPPYIEAVATTNALNKLKEEKLSLGQELGELKESLDTAADLVANVLKLSLGLVRLLNKKGFSTDISIGELLSNTADSVADAVLTWNLGVKPVVNTVDDLLHLSLDKFQSDQFLSVQGVHLTTGAPWAKLQGLEVDGELTRGSEVGLTYVVRDPLKQQLGELGLLNPLSIGWELVPLSFVLDYFMDIGGFLSALSGPIGLEFAHGYRTRFVRGDYEYRRSAGSYYSGEYKWDVNINGFERAVIYSSPLPTVAITLSLNLTRLSNILALMQRRL